MQKQLETLQKLKTMRFKLNQIHKIKFTLLYSLAK